MSDSKIHLFILAVFAFALCIPALAVQFPDSQDGVFALMAFQSFSGQLYSGEIYPRWLYDFYDGFGAPMFYYYPPFLFYLEAFIDILSFRLLPDYLILGMTAAVLHMTSAIACYIWLRDMVESRQALLGALTYVLLPNHLIIDLYYKGTLTELSAYTFLPLLLLFMKRAAYDYKAIILTAICYALLIMSSVPMALAFTPFLLLYSGYNFWEHKSVTVLMKSLSGLALGFGLAGAHIITAYLLTDYITPEKFWTGFYDPRQWFICTATCDHSPYPYMSQKISNILWLQFAAIAAMFMACLTKTQIKQEKYRHVFWFVIAAGAMFMMSEASIFFWDHLPLIERIQFPWRLALALELAFVFFMVQTFPLKRQSLRIAEYAALASLCGFIVLSTYTGYIFKNRGTLYDQPTFDKMAESKDYFGVYVPNFAEIDKRDLMGHDMPFAAADDASITNIQKIPGGFSFNISSPAATTIKMRQLYFPSWAAFSDTQEGKYNLRPNKDGGYIEIDYPGGENTVYLKHETLREEKIGLGISIISALLLLVLFAYSRKAKTLQTGNIKA